MRPAHSRSAAVRGSRSRRIETAAWVSNQRTRLEPALVIRPRRCVSPSSAREGRAPGRPRPRVGGGGARPRRSPPRRPPPSPARCSARSAGGAPARRSP
jgi:hypothetical protein